MAKKIRASKTLFITVEGEPRSGCSIERYAKVHPNTVTEAMYAKFIDLSVDSAIKEQHWQITYCPIYLFIRAWYKPPKQSSLKKYSKPGLQAPTRARIDSLVEVVMEAIIGKVINRAALVCSLNIEKRYTEKEPRLEIFIGIPSDWEELDNDMSYAEETSEELEKQQE